MQTQFPFADFTIRDEIQQATDFGGEILKDLEHGAFGSFGGVRFRGGNGEMDIRLGGGDVVDAFGGDGVGDYVATFADPPGDARGVN